MNALKLPLEIRELIYREYFGFTEAVRPCGIQYQAIYDADLSENPGCDRLVEQPRVSTAHVLSLLLTSKDVAHEASRVLYNHTEFMFTDIVHELPPVGEGKDGKHLAHGSKLLNDPAEGSSDHCDCCKVSARLAKPVDYICGGLGNDLYHPVDFRQNDITCMLPWLRRIGKANMAMLRKVTLHFTNDLSVAPFGTKLHVPYNDQETESTAVSTVATYGIEHDDNSITGGDILIRVIQLLTQAGTLKNPKFTFPELPDPRKILHPCDPPSHGWMDWWFDSPDYEKRQTIREGRNAFIALFSEDSDVRKALSVMRGVKLEVVLQYERLIFAGGEWDEEFVDMIQEAAKSLEALKKDMAGMQFQIFDI